MKRKNDPDNWEWEKKPKRIEKGTKKTGKHRRSLYNMLSNNEEDYFDEEFDSEVSVRNNRNYVKR